MISKPILQEGKYILKLCDMCDMIYDDMYRGFSMDQPERLEASENNLHVEIDTDGAA